jgi:D-alanyl-D-alanine carboxypeptidase
VLNASAFDGMYRHPEWPPDRDSRWYQAPISALSYNDNVVIVSVGRGRHPGAPAQRGDQSGHRRRAGAVARAHAREGRKDPRGRVAAERDRSS